MEVITVNASDLEIIRARQSLAETFGGSLDAKRPASWVSYGYPEQVTFAQLYAAYERTGPGAGAVHRLIDKCWQECPRIKAPASDEETPWETSTAKTLQALNVWKKFKDFDRRNLVGRYAGLIYRVADGLALREPMVRANRLVDIVPLFEDQLQVTGWNSEQGSPDYGKPTMWQYRSRRPGASGDQQGKPEEWVDVHPSRVQILAEGSVGDFFDGVPLLRAGFNHLIDLEKIGGGSAESFLKNSARTIVLKYDANASVQALASTPGQATPTDLKTAIEEKGRALNRNIDSTLVLQGGDASTLQTTVSDPTGAFQLAANLFAASVQIPFTVLFGQQTGRLASDEDKADMIARCKARQNGELTPAIVEFITRMQAAGLIEAGEFEVEWPPLDAPGDDAKATLLGKMTAAMQQAFASGLADPLFDANELRGVMDYEERDDDGMPGEGDDPDAVLDDDPMADPLQQPAPIRRAA
jgi:hypothetical protein